MMMRTWRHTTIRAALLTAAMALSAVGCGAQQDDEAGDDGETAIVAQVVAPQSDAAKTKCATAYTRCLLGAWDDVLKPSTGLTPLTKCTREAETCGLFEDAPDAGTGLTPTCGFEVADCYLKNPGNSAKCQQLPCRDGARSAP
jgi:hypothetical protein